MGIVNSYTYMLAYTDNDGNWSYAFPGEIDAVLEKKPSKIRYYMRSNKFCGTKSPHVVSFKEDFKGIRLKNSYVDISNVLTYASKNITEPKFDFTNAFEDATFNFNNDFPLRGTYQYNNVTPSFGEIAATPFNWKMYTNIVSEGIICNDSSSVFGQTFYPKSIAFSSAYSNSGNGCKLPILVQKNVIDMLSITYSTAYTGLKFKFKEYSSSNGNNAINPDNAYLRIDETTITPIRLGNTYLKGTYDNSISTQMLWIIIDGQEPESLNLFIDEAHTTSMPSPKYIYCGQSLNVYPEVLPDNAANKAVCVSVNDSSILNYLVEPKDETDKAGYDNNAISYIEFTGISKGNCMVTFSTIDNNAATTKLLDIRVKDVYPESLNEDYESSLRLPEGQSVIKTFVFYGKELESNNPLPITYFNELVYSNNTSNVDSSIKCVRHIHKNPDDESSKNYTELDIFITPKSKSSGNTISVKVEQENGSFKNFSIDVDVIDKISELSLNYSNYKMNIGDKIRISASMVIKDSNGNYIEPDRYDWNLEFSEENKDFLKINENYSSLQNEGNFVDITACKDGMQYDWIESPTTYLVCKAYINDDSYETRCSIIVNAIMPTNTTFINEINMNLSETKFISPTFVPSNTTYKKISWEYESDYVSISDDGSHEKYSIKANKATPRYTNAIAICNGVKNTITISINDAIVDVKFAENEMTLIVGQSKQIEYYLISTPPEYKNNAILTWTSNNEFFATVDNNGIVSALRIGSAIITCASSLGSSATIKITIEGSSL